MRVRTTAISVGLIIAAGGIAVGCDDVTEDCACTLEFRSFTLTVLDPDSLPADSVDLRVASTRTGGVFDIRQIDLNLPVGTYVIFDDSFVQDIPTGGEPVRVTGSKDNLSFSADFIFDTDVCRCHVSKIAGPDSVVLTQ